MTNDRPVVLIVDDLPTNLQFLAEVLQPDYQVKAATNGPDALTFARLAPYPDVILLDVMMPGMDGYALCAALKQEAATAAIPVIFITGKTDPQSETLALTGGAVDFIHKPINPTVVRARVRLHLELAQHRNHLEDLVQARTLELAQARDAADSANRAKVALEYLTGHDPLTGLPNRSLFLDRLGQALLRAQREHGLVALLFLDLDRFKSINDSLGHPAGDLVLKQAAERMLGRVREGDTVARLGGDEFTVVLGALADGCTAGQVAFKLIEAFRAPFVIDGRPLAVTVSIGISLYPDDATDIDTLVGHADAAMYRAKDGGGDSFRFYNEDMTARALALVALEIDLRQALAQGELALHYQPQIELATGRIAGLEALIRWDHPMRGLVEPNQFLPLAESTGLIVPISAWVVRAAATQMKAWRAQGLLTDAVIWVNLSTRDLQNPRLAESIADIIGEVGLETNALAVEITETWIMANPASATGHILRLQALGIEVGIDDCGKGYASLATVQCLSVRELKIDRSCVAGLPGAAGADAIARAIIALGDALGLRVVAEGVETAAQADFLRTAGCRIGQGYLFSRPLPAAAFAVYARGGTQVTESIHASPR
jgi:diguanylate cyclase (GGDEF)-like protein